MSKEQSNPIIEEVWSVRDAYAKRLGFDLRAILEDQKRLAQKLREKGFKVESSSQIDELKQAGRGGAK